jgi:hypothetical protein
MSQADGLSATVKSSENIGPQIAAVAGGWRESILVLAMVLAPVPLAIIHARGTCRNTNKREPSAIWTAVLHCHQLDRRGGGVALVIAPGVTP